MDKSKELSEFIHHIVHHELEDALGSAPVINRGIGEAMRHIGYMVNANSFAYLPVRQEEHLCKPIKFSTEDVGVILINREVFHKSAFSVMANAVTEGDERKFELSAFVPNSFNMLGTKFISLPEQIGNEIIRQLNEIMKVDGKILVQVVVIPEYFEVPAPAVSTGDDGLFDSQTAESADPELVPVPAPTTKAPAPEAPAAKGGLPDVVVDERLL